MSSSMKKAAKAAGRPHRERAQPSERQRLGLLEKHRDYTARARDYKKKQATLKNLRRKATERNEDEFAFGMMSRRGPGTALTRGRGAFTGTVDGDRGNQSLSVETVRLLKTQDMQYVRTMRSVADKEVRVLVERVVLAGGAVDDVGEDEDGSQEDDHDEPKPSVKTTVKKAKKIVFLDDVDERKQAMDSWREQKQAVDTVGDDEQQRSETLQSLVTKLRNAKHKLKSLTDAERELDAQRARMAKTPTYGGITKKGKQIKVRERKR